MYIYLFTLTEESYSLTQFDDLTTYLRCELPAGLHGHHHHGDDGVRDGEVKHQIVDIGP